MERIIREEVCGCYFVLAVRIFGNCLYHLVVKAHTVFVFCFSVINHGQFHRNKYSSQLRVGFFQNSFSQRSSGLTTIDNLQVNDFRNIKLTVDLLSFYIRSSSGYTVVVCKKLVRLVIDCSAYTAVYTLGSTCAKESTYISFKYLTSMVNINVSEQFAWYDSNIGFISEIFSNVSLDTRDTE